VPTATQGTSQQPFGYTGQQQDGNGLVYLRARYYDPQSGRFLSRDAAQGKVDDPLSLDRYAYAHDRPTLLVDPSGNDDCAGLSGGEGCIDGGGPDGGFVSAGTAEGAEELAGESDSGSELTNRIDSYSRNVAAKKNLGTDLEAHHIIPARWGDRFGQILGKFNPHRDAPSILLDAEGVHKRLTAALFKLKGEIGKN
jgi:RHS repeat-associated protein